MSEELKSALPTGSLKGATVTFFREEGGSGAVCALSYAPAFGVAKLAGAGNKPKCRYTPSPERETTNEIIYNYGIA